jgi:hypothetical protein
MRQRRKVYVSLFLAATFSLLQNCSVDKLYQMRQRQKVYAFEQINFKDLMNRYLAKDGASIGTIEGIYSVSVVIIKKGKGLLSSTEKEKTVERRENYSKVAIIRDPGNANREYIEISMNKEFQLSCAVLGDFTRATDSNILIYKHFESKGKNSSYTFTYDNASDLLEGIRTENNGSTTYTYKLTYIKLFPKVNDKAKM